MPDGADEGKAERQPEELGRRGDESTVIRRHVGSRRRTELTEMSQSARSQTGTGHWRMKEPRTRSQECEALVPQTEQKRSLSRCDVARSLSLLSD